MKPLGKLTRSLRRWVKVFCNIQLIEVGVEEILQNTDTGTIKFKPRKPVASSGAVCPSPLGMD
jgi:hypothetical protein